MLPRFFVPSLDPAAPEIPLPSDEAHHLTRVLRLQSGDEVAIFDGRGREYRARVRSTGRDAATVTLIAPVESVAAPVAVTLVQAVLKPDGMDMAVRDATMLGVERIQPVLSARTTVKAALLPKAVDRWRRLALSSAKQCGRARLPDIERPVGFEEWLAAPDVTGALLMVEPGAAVEGARTIRHIARDAVPARATVIVGPEGGWTPAERDLALDRGCIPLSLGRLTLRAEAVPLAAVAALLAVWDERG